MNANFICMLIKNQLPWQPETFMRGFRFRSSFDLRPKQEVLLACSWRRRMPPHAKNFPFRRQIRTNYGSSFNNKQEYLQTSTKNLFILRNLVSSPCSCLENARGPTLLSKGKTPGTRLYPTGSQDGWCFSGNKNIPFGNSKLNKPMKSFSLTHSILFG